MNPHETEGFEIALGPNSGPVELVAGEVPQTVWAASGRADRTKGRSLPAGSLHEDGAPPCPFDFLVAGSFQKLQEESIFFIVFVHRLCLAHGTCPRGQIPQLLLDAGRTCPVFTSTSAKAGRGKEAGRLEARAPAHSLPSPRTLPGPRPVERDPGPLL